jgi:hypothetical protein
MKRTVRVTIEKEFIIDIPDHLLTAEYIKEFEDFIGERYEDNKQDGLFKYAAWHAAKDYNEAEGLGYLDAEYKKKYMDRPEDFIVVEEIYEDTEEEVLCD